MVSIPTFLAGAFLVAITAIVTALITGIFKIKHDRDKYKSSLNLESKKVLLSLDSSIFLSLLQNQVETSPVVIQSIISTWKDGVLLYTYWNKLHQDKPIIDFSDMDPRTRLSFLEVSIDNDILIRHRSKRFYESSKDLDDVFISKAAFIHPDIYDECLNIKDRICDMALKLVHISSSYLNVDTDYAISLWREEIGIQQSMYSLITKYHKSIWPKY